MTGIKVNQPHVFILRGVSGSGKSTLARAIARYYNMRVNSQRPHVPMVHVESDMYFMRDGEYKFNSAELGNAHAWCFSSVCQALDHGYGVIVSNTFTTAWEYMPYVNHARENGYKFHIITCRGNYQNTHDVPEDKVQAQRDRFEPTLTELWRYHEYDHTAWLYYSYI